MPAGEEATPETEREGRPITAAEANKLMDEEIEVFAREFLAHNSDLLETYESAKSEARTNQKGERVISIRRDGSSCQRIRMKRIPITLPASSGATWMNRDEDLSS